MKTDRESLEKFLRAHAKEPEMVSEAMRLLEPLFVKAEKGGYDLSESSEHLALHAKGAIAQATGKKVKEVIFISDLGHSSKTEWMSWEAYENSLGAGSSAALNASLWDNLGVSLWNSLWNSRYDGLWLGLYHSLIYYLEFMLVGDKGTVEMLTPLMELQPHAFPLHEKQPGTWLVLCE